MENNKVTIKYHERTEAKNQLFTLDTSIHTHIKELVDNIPYDYKNKYIKPIDISKYSGIEFYGTFYGYSIIDGKSMFIINVGIAEIRDIKLKKLLNL